MCWSKLFLIMYFFFSDSLTLQLWKDRRDWEKNPGPTKGSIALEEYLGWEAGFTLDRESQTLAIILKKDILSLALDNRENLMRWQVRLTSQFEEGQHFNAYLIQTKSKSSNAGNVNIISDIFFIFLDIRVKK